MGMTIGGDSDFIDFIPYTRVYIGKDRPSLKYGDKCLVVSEYSGCYVINYGDNNRHIAKIYPKKTKYFVTEIEYRKLKIKKLYKKSSNTFPNNILKWILKKDKW